MSAISAAAAIARRRPIRTPRTGQRRRAGRANGMPVTIRRSRSADARPAARSAPPAPLVGARVAELLLIAAGSWLSTEGRLPPGISRWALRRLNGRVRRTARARPLNEVAAAGWARLRPRGDGEGIAID